MRTHALILIALMLLVVSVSYAPVGGGGLVTTSTNSASRTQTFHTTNNAVEVDNYLTRLTARAGNGAIVFDQTFTGQLADSAVQAAIQQARNMLTSGGATSISGPNQTSNVKTATGTRAYGKAYTSFDDPSKPQKMAGTNPTAPERRTALAHRLCGGAFPPHSLGTLTDRPRSERGGCLSVL